MARPKDRKAKERKEKIALGVLGGVLLVVVVIFVLPMVMKGGSSSSAATPPATTTPAGTPAGTPGAGTPVSAAQSEVVFTASADTLSSYGRFALKDPFNAHGAADTSSESAAATAPMSTPPAPVKQSAPARQTGPVFGTVQGAKSGSSKSGVVPSATLRVGGTTMHVKLGETFPKKNPTFRLAGVTPAGVTVTVVKGTLADGSHLLDLLKGFPVTLVNTATGGRVTLEFLSASKAT